METLLRLVERGLVPDPVIRFGSRRLLAARLRDEDPGGDEAREDHKERFVRELRQSPVALAAEAANRQHYELPTAFFRLVLGRHLKYSSCYWPPGVSTLDDAEEAMLERTAARAGIEDGQEVLELGCGWGSLSLYLAGRFPGASILAVSNSATQGEHIRTEARRRGLANLEVETADMNAFATGRRFDRVVSVEMFEHMRNWEELLGRIATWMHPEARLFIHVFCHRRLAYPFEVRGATDWMARYFFTGGLMPSADLLPRFLDTLPLELEESWLVEGTHYAETAGAWLANMDRRKEEVLPLLEETYGPGQERRWWTYWRLFFIACQELFAYRGGTEWMVAHYRLRRSET